MLSYLKNFKKIKRVLYKVKRFFCIPQAPVGLSAMGIKSDYLENINTFNYSTGRFYNDLISPVNEPYFLNA